MILDISKEAGTVIMHELSLYWQSFMADKIVNDRCNAQRRFCVLSEYWYRPYHDLFNSTNLLSKWKVTINLYVQEAQNEQLIDRFINVTINR